MVERIPQHKHCRNCDKAVPADKQYCDDECEQHHKANIKAKKKQLQIFYVVMIVIFIFALLLSFGG
jgi:predicted nucleic acid-binding Zn ribbon protein